MSLIALAEQREQFAFDGSGYTNVPGLVINVSTGDRPAELEASLGLVIQGPVEDPVSGWMQIVDFTNMVPLAWAVLQFPGPVDGFTSVWAPLLKTYIPAGIEDHQYVVQVTVPGTGSMHLAPSWQEASIPTFAAKGL